MMIDHGEKFDDLEISVNRREGEPMWAVDLRFAAAGSESDLRICADIDPPDLSHLHGLEFKPAEYGEALRDAVFSTPSLRRNIARAVAASETKDHRLRIRIVTPIADQSLRSIRWELMLLPDRPQAVGLDDRFVVSRYVDSADLRPVTVRSKGDIRAVIVVAGTGEDRFQADGRTLDPIDVEQEVRLATGALDRCTIALLAGPGDATVERIREALTDGGDLLYIVCHGAMGDDGPVLLLHRDGHAGFIKGELLVEAIASLPRPPRLVVLASCQTAGGGSSLDHGAMAALGPLLAAAGVPAVVAMQGDVTQRMVAAFMPTFFAELNRHGRIDVAMAAARRLVFFEGRSEDWWGPVLFMRLRSGRLWYSSGSGDSDNEFAKWPALVSSIRDGRCVAVCGMGLTDSLMGNREEIARTWARTYAYPLAPSGSQDLAQVAQYVSVTQDSEFIRAQLRIHIISELKRRYASKVSGLDAHPTLDGLLRHVWRSSRATIPGEPHSVLAELPFSYYINAHTSGLLIEALRNAGREPEALIFRWRDDLVEPDDKSAGDAPSFESSWEDDYLPSPERPLVLQMFGSLRVPESLILTEDDYFDYLIGLTRNFKDRVAPSVQRALASNPLMFLGFGMQDWDFRILSRTIQTLGGGGRKRSKRTNVSAQIGPNEIDSRDMDAAREYIGQYLNDSDINVFWGSVDEFCMQLHTAWQNSLREERAS